jgi:hypothetical protein
MRKDLKKLIRIAIQHGWLVEYTGGGHYKWTPPDKSAPVLYSASTPSDSRALDNHRCRLRRAGLKAA